ncbi:MULTISPECIES: 2,4-diaminopentanoate dehydrogenase [unclassified Halanaerobium]|uniref:2,4-diaminopentanoate dehydrogenase n=1 Tax=unclassified Halanaerobium TaxID=2641197 RepID=UPI000DF147E8|nr:MULTISPECIES: 2,4-diaminopentanoate dehydrogenase [unclassified Halanaerobium]RCW41707.1 4-hydroxy-tetrahydrodipicolinate reductase [Halanaerobium sp. MA284_MarDTE_T2]RCW79282.1 4-hydroxy-tetrahydrodipicolinate reductase [Halanaerobium sp. DL-01]
MENIKVLIWGFGEMGSGMAKMLLKKKGVDIVGVCDSDPNKVSKSIYEVLDVKQGDNPEVIIKDDIELIIEETEADVALIATDSFVKKAYDKIVLCLKNKLNVISTAEEMAYPQAQSPELAQKLDDIAKKNNVSLLGTGINPGLIMDLLVILLTGACESVDNIKVERINNLSPFGPAVMEEQGVGKTAEEFKEGVENNTISGHVGFAESIKMITDALGWKSENPIKQKITPIISNVDRNAPNISVKAGEVAGVRMEACDIVNDQKRIEMIHPQQVEPQEENVETGDYIYINGNPDIKMSIKPEVPGGIGTVAMCVNMIPQIINADAGLKTMIDLPVPRAIMGDMRELIK